MGAILDGAEVVIVLVDVSDPAGVASAHAVSSLAAGSPLSIAVLSIPLHIADDAERLVALLGLARIPGLCRHATSVVGRHLLGRWGGGTVAEPELAAKAVETTAGIAAEWLGFLDRPGGTDPDQCDLLATSRGSFYAAVETPWACGTRRAFLASAAALASPALAEGIGAGLDLALVRVHADRSLALAELDMVVYALWQVTREGGRPFVAVDEDERAGGRVRVSVLGFHFTARPDAGGPPPGWRRSSKGR
jgi:hypothetical protein